MARSRQTLAPGTFPCFAMLFFSSAVPGGLFSFSLDPGIKITWGKAELIIIGYIKYKETKK